MNVGEDATNAILGELVYTLIKSQQDPLCAALPDSVHVSVFCRYSGLLLIYARSSVEGDDVEIVKNFLSDRRGCRQLDREIWEKCLDD